MSTTMFNKHLVTLDVDWAPDEVIRYTIDLLAKYGVKATLFATHESDYLKSLDMNKYEIGIHPNFNQGGDHSEIIEKLKAIYPDSIGVRSHSLFQSSQLLQLFIDNGLKYEVNTFIPLMEGIHPFVRVKGIVSIPFYWEDDYHYLLGTPFELCQLKVDKEGLKIYNFHPIHVFMNTNSAEHYNSFKAFYNDLDILKKHRNNGKGIRTLFVGLLRYLTSNNLPTHTCEEICSKYISAGKPL